MKGWREANMFGKELITRELLESCKGMIRLSDIWLPILTDEEHEGEAKALHLARTKMLNAISRAEGKS